MRLKIRYFDNEQKKIVTIEAETNGVTVDIPEHDPFGEGIQPPLSVKVLTDGVTVEFTRGAPSTVSHHEYLKLIEKM